MSYLIRDVVNVDILLMKAFALLMLVSISYHSVNWLGVPSGDSGTPTYLVDFEDR